MSEENKQALYEAKLAAYSAARAAYGARTSTTVRQVLDDAAQGALVIVMALTIFASIVLVVTGPAILASSFNTPWWLAIYLLYLPIVAWFIGRAIRN